MRIFIQFDRVESATKAQVDLQVGEVEDQGRRGGG